MAVSVINFGTRRCSFLPLVRTRREEREGGKSPPRPPRRLQHTRQLQHASRASPSHRCSAAPSCAAHTACVTRSCRPHCMCPYVAHTHVLYARRGNVRLQNCGSQRVAVHGATDTRAGACAVGSLSRQISSSLAVHDTILHHNAQAERRSLPHPSATRRAPGSISCSSTPLGNGLLVPATHATRVALKETVVAGGHEVTAARASAIGAACAAHSTGARVGRESHRPAQLLVRVLVGPRVDELGERKDLRGVPWEHLLEQRLELLGRKNRTVAVAAQSFARPTLLARKGMPAQ